MANLVELYDLVIQAQSFNGVPLSHGHVYVYALGRTKLMDTWSDIDGESLNTNPVILDNAGQAHIYVSDDFDYTLVFTDEFDNEVFSVDKYLLSKGEHSHADVAVAPSEHIGVSSYHVGEVTVYVPYLTGEVGKTYEGIDPIVVNNTLNRISANHIPLGVQDPLYFVEDSESACIIGMSGGIVPEGTMVESSLGFENNKITGYNGSAFSAGNEYEAGNYISITDNTISVTGLTPVPADTASTGLVAQVSADIVSQIPSTAGLATTAQLNEKLDKADSANFLLTSDSANFYPMNSNPSGYINELPSDLATTGWVDSQGYLTAVDIPESAVWNATTQTVSANSAAWAGGTANPQIPVTGINGIKISESGDKVVFEVSANYATEDWVTGQGYLTAETDWTNTITAASANAYNEATAAIPAPFDPTYLSGQIDTKLDSAIYAADSGSFITALPQDLVYTADIQDMATTGDLTGKQDITGMTAYATVESLTAKQDAGNYLSATDSANFLLTSDSGNFYPMNQNPSGYLTAHQSLADYQTTADMVNYQTTADMTAYQPVGDYMTTADSANFYTTANESGFISEVPAGTMNESAFEYDANDKISGYNGSAFAGGSDVPEGVMVESGIEYNAVNEISGYNGSAIAQYGAEKQWLVTDDTMVHLSNSAQYALGVNLSAVAQLLGVDETVLWSGTSANSFTLSEPSMNFKKLRIKLRSYQSPDYYTYCECLANSAAFHFEFENQVPAAGQQCQYAGFRYSTTDDLTYNFVAGRRFCFGPSTYVDTANDLTNSNLKDAGYPVEIIGIGRKQ